MKIFSLITVLLSLFIFVSCGDSASASNEAVTSSPVSVGSGEFEQGNDYKILYAHGTAYLTCQGMLDGRFVMMQRTLVCNYPFTHPAAFSKFINVGSKAHDVKITNMSNDNYSKTHSFNAKKGESKEFNLLIGSLFQKPLLRNGINNLKYEMIMKDGTVEESGDMLINVETTMKTCQTIFMNSYDLNECQMGGYNVCSRYYYESRCL